MKDHDQHEEHRVGRGRIDLALRQTLAEAEAPGSVVEFDPDDADQAGAFQDEALTIEDALDSGPDLLERAP